MLDEKKIIDYIDIVKGRILEREKKYREMDTGKLSAMDHICHLIKMEQLKQYKKFVKDFEKNILLLSEDNEEYGPAL